ncbi:FGGY-family carbohydrate kinase [Azospirillum sp. TSO35-2]|uniref:FGGY-family carbohydrate kinase n=1 Tax=Azospirillum sp. TSO35-2 TaxID=716796 RepID=UPI000D61AA78|nr:FGGY-family carbohydrate kinase [Azospirillum sp. TSO35-2]PWC37535.1 ribulokinase [Azospirillum sp. TSO35-2]
MRDLVCAVDVGTTSARAGILDRTGALLARAEHPLRLSRPRPDHAEHDSEDVWRAVCRAVAAARVKAGAGAERVAAIAWDATCSLVVRGEQGRQVSVSADGGPDEGPAGDGTCWDTMVWLDHRAMAEADDCTATGHRVLSHLGGVMSPEMQTPKLMWLKRHRPDRWRDARLFFDLADFLSWRACGSTARSQCTLTCKWTYLAHADGWQRDFFEGLGVGDLLEQGGLPARATPVGTALGHLTERAARELTLDTSCVVGAGLVDAFAGALGVVGGHAEGSDDRRAALITGTSSCITGFSRRPRSAPGVWGPYFGAVLPEHWLVESGQSATGALLDHVIQVFGGTPPSAAAHAAIIARITAMRRDPDADLGRDLHILPDFHGNRSPFADPHARGVISGLTLDSSFDGLCRVYWRTAVAIALGVRHILEGLADHGYPIDALHVAGGHSRNPLLMELYADATKAAIHETTAADAVLSGTAMVAATAAGWYGSLAESARAMQQPCHRRAANPASAAGYERDYRIFRRMHAHRLELQELGRG